MFYRLLNAKRFTLKAKRGFTLIEILVVLGIMAMLTSIAILYSRTSEQQIILFKEQAKAVSVISRAKSLAIQTFAAAPGVCGYGVRFNSDGTYILFRDLPETGADCGSADQRYSGEAENFETNQLDPALRFSELGLDEILFIPPDPLVLITPAPTNSAAIIKIGIQGGATESIIKVSKAGQVTTQ